MDRSTSLPSIKIVVRRIWSGVIIDANGVLDLISSPTFAEYYESAQSHLGKMSEPQTLVLDLRNLTFIDSAGLALLIRISREMIASRHDFNVVVRDGTQPDRVIKLGHFDKILNATYDFDERA